MLDRLSRDATAYVALRRAPARAIFKVASPECPIADLSSATSIGATKCITTRYTVLYSKLRPPELPRRRGSIDANSALKKRHRSQEAHVCKETAPARVKWGTSSHRRPPECPTVVEPKRPDGPAKRKNGLDEDQISSPARKN